MYLIFFGNTATAGEKNYFKNNCQLSVSKALHIGKQFNHWFRLFCLKFRFKKRKIQKKNVDPSCVKPAFFRLKIYCERAFTPQSFRIEMTETFIYQVAEMNARGLLCLPSERVMNNLE